MDEPECEACHSTQELSQYTFADVEFSRRAWFCANCAKGNTWLRPAVDPGKDRYTEIIALLNRILEEVKEINQEMVPY